MTYQVIVQSRALRDIEEIFRWLADQMGPDAANKWYDELQSAIESLATFPNRCPLALEAKSLKREVRQLMVGKRKQFRVLFIVQNSRVAVVHVRHSRRSRLSPDDNIL
ncbi:type II toxin-antitoxin system RelE/ParE family toxin [Acaryochloris marina]|uniref:type II toxin-antitoxin system RelE/ParE family toxin n=1 Tax=Acaryochloris marina TaxID=155978 RepID=UPI001BAEE276|nr:type II toxin-antitoxin system RelE/ParE family toxin [Acaryochloris marina]QUY42493.1 type II toxin-antitoxin system RelE/ParE family toxin [Acaryochloris marina S15]